MSEYERYKERKAEIDAVLGFFKAHKSKYCIILKNPVLGTPYGEPLADFEIRDLVYDTYDIDFKEVQDDMDAIIRNAGKVA